MIRNDYFLIIQSGTILKIGNFPFFFRMFHLKFDTWFYFFKKANSSSTIADDAGYCLFIFVSERLCAKRRNTFSERRFNSKFKKKIERDYWIFSSLWSVLSYLILGWQICFDREDSLFPCQWIQLMTKLVVIKLEEKKDSWLWIQKKE